MLRPLKGKVNSSLHYMLLREKSFFLYVPVRLLPRNAAYSSQDHPYCQWKMRGKPSGENQSRDSTIGTQVHTAPTLPSHRELGLYNTGVLRLHHFQKK